MTDKDYSQYRGSSEQFSPKAHLSQTDAMHFQLLMDLQKSTGELSGKLDQIANRIERLDGRLTTACTDIAKIQTKIKIAMVIGTILLICAGFLINNMWDELSSIIGELLTAENK